MNSLSQYRPVYNEVLQDIDLPEEYPQRMTLNQLQQLVRQANVEYALNPEKDYSYHIYDKLFTFNRKEAVNFLMVGVGDVFFEAPKALVLSLVGRYYLGDYAKRVV
jgi:hypothetical protein